MDLGHQEAKPNEPDNFWADREAGAKRALDRKLRAMSPEDRAAALAADKKVQERRREAAAQAEREEASLREALIQSAAGTKKGEGLMETGKKISQAIEVLKQGEDEAYLVYLKTKVSEAEKKVQSALREGMIDETDSEALADWKQKLADQEAKIKAEQPYEEITITPWKKAS